MPKDWVHARGLDWHTHNPLAICWLSVSPQDEVFVWEEWGPNPQRFTTWEISREIAIKSKDYVYSLDIIDPLANVKQVNTGRSPCEDLNLHAMAWKREGLGTGAYFQAADTRNERGIDEIRMRLANSLKVGKPFNNRNPRLAPGEKLYLPTLWITDNCRQTIESLRNWRREEWRDRDSKLTKDEKDKPEQKYSHFCRAIDYLLKRDEIAKAHFGPWNGRPIRPKYYLTGEAR